jgi:hypothetical protein
MVGGALLHGRTTSMARTLLITMLAVGGVGCGSITTRNGMQPLVEALKLEAQKSSDEKVKEVVPNYIKALDSLRIINLEAVLTQRRKRDWYLSGALGFSAGAAITAASNMDDGDKAALTGVFAAVGGLLTALNAKFRHDEDAALSETCAKLSEKELIGFRIPANMDTFYTQREDFAKRWKEAECPAAQTRLGAWPTQKDQLKDSPTTTERSAP